MSWMYASRVPMGVPGHVGLRGRGEPDPGLGPIPGPGSRGR